MSGSSLSSKVRNVVKTFSSLMRDISVEPAIFLAGITISIGMILNQVGLYKVMCEKLKADGFEVNGSSTLDAIECWAPGNSTTAPPVLFEIKLQESMATWFMFMSMSYMVPCIFADIFLGAYSDQHGRKYNILLGVLGLLFTLIPQPILFFWPVATPMYILVIANVLSGLTGSIPIATISAASYVADTVADSSQLTLRMTILAIIGTVAQVVGTLLAKFLLAVIPFWAASLVAILLAVLTIICVLIMVKQALPKELRKLAQLKASGASREEINRQLTLAKTTSQNRPPIGKQVTAVFIAGVDLIKSVWRTFSKKRQGHGRMHLLIVGLVVFVFIAVYDLQSANVFSLFAQKAPFKWDQNELANYKSISSAVALISSTLGIFIFKKRFHFSDSLIIVLSLLSAVCAVTAIGISDSDWQLYTAAGLGLLIPLLVPCAQSFVAKKVETDEVGKAYSAFSLGMNLANFVNMMIFNAIYKATVAYFAGFVFFLGAVLLLIVMGLMIWVHVDSHDYYWKLCGRKERDMKF